LSDCTRSAHDPDVLIVAHDSGPLLNGAVSSAIAQAGAGHVWVMDAESVDSSVQALRHGSAPHVVRVPNHGFAAGNNRGIEATSAPYVLLLNPDAVLQEGALDALVTTLEARPRAAIVGSLVLNPDGSTQANSYGRYPSFTSALSLRLWRLWQRLRGNVNLSPKVPASTAQVDWVTGAAMLVRRAAIADVGPMDEGFFLYYEDIDWCWRMRAGGWEVLLEPSARVVHHLGGSNAPATSMAGAYRASFYRYCDLRGLWGLKMASRVGLALWRLLRGRA
jgi:N-acetylglucosaminyl-diphospho-decaprenol L-rhamnosyltransferase